MFEPDDDLLNKAKDRLKNSRDIVYINAGAYSNDGELRFSSSGRTNGAISGEGDLVIKVNKVDTVVNHMPTILKMDIEGSEADALIGSKEKIKKCRPKLAIAAYHYGRDLWYLADVIREIRSDYRIYLRHYSETGLESVLYAI
jgi:FkbM family methyltransferase